MQGRIRPNVYKKPKRAIKLISEKTLYVPWLLVPSNILIKTKPEQNQESSRSRRKENKRREKAESQATQTNNGVNKKKRAKC